MNLTDDEKNRISDMTARIFTILIQDSPKIAAMACLSSLILIRNQSDQPDTVLQLIESTIDGMKKNFRRQLPSQEPS